ncbi:MAG TPA: hypothetical protein VLC54_15495, partial [Anaeromyxobacter sp.]|nr:hypothetical protein [Anaeromyxobacter sp.]
MLAPLTLALALAAADAVGEGGVAAAKAPSTARPSGTWTATLMTGSLTAVHPERSAAAGGAESRDALAGANAQDEYGWEGSDEEDGSPRLFITAWGGQAFDVGGGDGHSGSAFGGEVAYALGFGDLGLRL